MKLIVGLGNPGRDYQNTRHNIGFMFIERYAKAHKCEEFKAKFQGEYTSFKMDGETVYLLRPLTYMNLSGFSVREISNFYKIPVEDILVVYDDKDIPFAALRIREKGNPGSHNGMKNITEQLASNNFKRVRVGIGKPISNDQMVDFVLSKFTKEEMISLEKTFEDTMKVCDLFVKNNINMAMNKYNFKKG